MSASKKSANTSKTARVMNLLSKNNAAPQPEQTTPLEPAGQQPQAPQANQVQPHAQPQPQPEATSLPPIMSSLASDAAASNQIKQGLEAALEELAALDIAEQPAPAEPLPTPEDVTPAPTTQAPATPPAVRMDEGSESASSPEVTYINVMLVLVDEKAEKYMDMFGLCRCQRCLADVKALALNNLPSKYVVMPKGEVSPRVTVYEGRYSSSVIAQLVQACKVVMEHPHHRDD